MTALIHWLTSQFSENPVLVAFIVLLLAASESLLVIGSIVPATTIIVAIAAAAGAAGAGLWPMFAAAVAGAAIGDGVSYWIGRRYGERIARWGPLARRPHVLSSAERYFRRRGTISIFVARFLPGIRTVVPAVAGISGMPVGRFTLANVGSGIIWAALHIFAAGLAGELLARIGGRLAMVLVGALILFGFAFWLARLAARASVPYVVRARHAVHQWAAARTDRPSRLLARTLQPDDPTGLLIALWSGILCGALILFGGLLEDVQEGDPIVEVDLGISRLLQTFRTPSLDDAMVTVTMFGDPIVLASVAVSVIAWLLWRRQWWVAGVFATASLVPLAVVPLIKITLGRARPLTDLYSGAEAFSFPSGHATNSAVLLGLLAVLVGGSLRGVARWSVVALFAAAALAIAFSRIYLQAHWPSDVLAGLAFAGAIIAAVILALGRVRALGLRPGSLAAVALSAAVVAGGLHVATGFKRSAAAYAPRDLAISITADAWRSGAWRDVAAGRIGIEGEVENRFILQWVGDLQPLRDVLASNGWAPAPSFGLSSLGYVLSGASPLDTIPPAPRLHLGLGASGTFVKPLEPGVSRLVFRLWPSRYSVAGRPLYVGAMEVEQIVRPLGLLTLVDDRSASPQAVRSFADAIRDDPAFADNGLLLPGAP